MKKVLSLSAVAVVLFASQSAQAQNVSTWAGGTTGTWSAAGSWSGTDKPPLATDTASFGGTTAATANLAGTATSINGVTVSNTAAMSS